MHDESLRLYRVSMRMDVIGFVLAENEAVAANTALAGLWCFSPVETPDLDSIDATEEPIERAKEAPRAST